MNDVTKRRKFRKYAQTVIRAIETAELGDAADHLLVVWNGLDVEFQRDIDEPDKITTLNVFFYKRKHQWWAQVFKMKPQQHHQPVTGQQKNLKNINQSIVNISFSRISNGNFSNFNHTRLFSQKMLVGKTGNFIVLLVTKIMFTIRISKIVNQTQTFNLVNSFKIIQIPILGTHPSVVRVIQIHPMLKINFRNVVHSEYMSAISKTVSNCRLITVIVKHQYNRRSKRHINFR